MNLFSLPTPNPRATFLLTCMLYLIPVWIYLKCDPIFSSARLFVWLPALIFTVIISSQSPVETYLFFFVAGKHTFVIDRPAAVRIHIQTSSIFCSFFLSVSHNVELLKIIIGTHVLHTYLSLWMKIMDSGCNRCDDDGCQLGIMSTQLCVHVESTPSSRRIVIYPMRESFNVNWLMIH